MLKVNLFSLCFMIVLTYAAPIEKDSDARILSNEYNIDEKGNYKFSFKTSNGLTREETGIIIDEGQSNQHLLVKGLIIYINQEGNQEYIKYIADENGYRIIKQDLSIPDALSANVVASLLGK